MTENNYKKNREMTTSYLISSNVINTIQSLPPEERSAISQALMNEMFFGHDPHSSLSPTQMIAYTFIKFNIDSDTRRISH